MYYLSQFIVFIAMALLTAVSMCTTYISLNDSILPKPALPIPLPNGMVWNCSLFALALSVAIGLMLFALKLAIVGKHRRLGITGVLGMTVVAFISITFNMDVLYRTADRDFFIRYSAARMRHAYEDYLVKVQHELQSKRDMLRRDIALQQGELEAEIKGVRQAPSGYGQIAKKEDYKLILLEKATQVELESIDASLLAMDTVNERLRTAAPATLEEVEELQNELRTLAREPGVAAGLVLPEAVRQESPLFAVIYNFFDLKSIGIKEIFFLMIAFFLDLGDIIGYSLVPQARTKTKRKLEFEPLPPPAKNLIEYRNPQETLAAPEPLPEPEESSSGDVEEAPAPIVHHTTLRRRRRHFRAYHIFIL